MQLSIFSKYVSMPIARALTYCSLFRAGPANCEALGKDCMMRPIYDTPNLKLHKSISTSFNPLIFHANWMQR
jgi:hypothetical protein